MTDWDAHSSGEALTRLDVSVQDVMGVTLCESTQDSAHVAGNLHAHVCSRETAAKCSGLAHASHGRLKRASGIECCLQGQGWETRMLQSRWGALLTVRSE